MQEGKVNPSGDRKVRTTALPMRLEKRWESQATDYVRTFKRPSALRPRDRGNHERGALAMSTIPLHLQRRFEQRWAARFVRPVASVTPKIIVAKGTINCLARPAKKARWLNPAGLAITGAGGLVSAACPVLVCNLVGHLQLGHRCFIRSQLSWRSWHSRNCYCHSRCVDRDGLAKARTTAAAKLGRLFH